MGCDPSLAIFVWIESTTMVWALYKLMADLTRRLATGIGFSDISPDDQEGFGFIDFFRGVHHAMNPLVPDSWHGQNSDARIVALLSSWLVPMTVRMNF